MNDPYTTDRPLNEATNAANECCAEMDQYVRRNPGAAVLAAVGVGLAIGLFVRAMRPEPTPQHRVARLLEDLEDRLRDVTGPMFRKAGSLASDGLDAAHEGRSRAEGLLSDATRRVRRMFS